jgi:DNA-binding NarL/FixJ family response regulator
MIKIVIICEQKEDRQMIAGLLSPQGDFRIVCTGSDGYDALKSAIDLQPDVYIMDMCLTGIDALQLAPMIKRKSPASAFIVLSSRDEDKYIIKAINAGISGYILKKTDMNILTHLVRIVSEGGCYINAPAMKRIFNTAFKSLGYIIKNRENFICPELLHCSPLLFSPTERQVIIGIARGHSDEKIAEDLHIRPGTVRNCISAAKRKTGLKNRAQIVIQSILCGLVRLPD